MAVMEKLSIIQSMDDKRPNWECLRDVAITQKGYFTAAQAKECGYGSDLLYHRASSGSFVRIRRGLYRLPDFPPSPDEEMMVAWLSVGREASVVSHESALAIHGISDVIPSSTHITVPRSRRGYRADPGVTLHTVVKPLENEEIVVRDGMKVTAPTRTIIDVASWGISPEHIESAVRDALRRGLTTRARLTEAAEDRGGNAKAELLHALARVSNEV
jgi:predicted transcriptional regulator of viral defense system